MWCEKCGILVSSVKWFEEDIDDVLSMFTELSFLQTRPRRKCVCMLIVSSLKRSALLLHVWRISITKRLRVHVCVSERHRQRMGRRLYL